MKIIFTVTCLLYFSVNGAAQSFAINTDGSTAHTSALLDVKSSNKGLLLPRMTDDEMRSIALPLTSLLVYNVTDSSMYTKRDTGWAKMVYGKADNYWNYNNGHIYKGNAGNVGIGVSNPIHAGLETSTTVGAVSAMFGVGKYGVSIEADNPEVGFNYYYNGGPRSIKAGYSANIGMYPSNGTVYIGNFGNNTSAADFGPLPAGSYKDRMLIYRNGTMVLGNDTSSYGKKLCWLADKGAFRAGTYWISAAPIGENSMALGEGCVSSGYASLSSGFFSTSSGFVSAVLGSGSTASGSSAMAFGNSCTASGINSVAAGNNAEASADYSTALGNFVKTNNQSGSFIIGDKEPNASVSQSFGNDAANQMMMRFVGGYKLYTAGWGFNIGTQLLPNATSWSSLSDKRMKENFIPVDGESVLQKIKNFNLTTWNYKNLDVKTERHYGPMAQDFYTAFGTDALGIIGCDTLINEHDFSSINFIAIQALEKRTQQIAIQQQQIDALKKQNAGLLERLSALENKK
jgi:hypothetical protein